MESESWDIHIFQDGFSFSGTLAYHIIFVKKPIENLIEIALNIESFEKLVHLKNIKSPDP